MLLNEVSWDLGLSGWSVTGGSVVPQRVSSSCLILCCVDVVEWNHWDPASFQLVQKIMGVCGMVSANPFTAPACKISRLKSAHTHTPANCIFDGLITNRLWILCFSVEILSMVCSCKGEKGSQWLQMWHFYWSSIAVKWLIQLTLWSWSTPQPCSIPSCCPNNIF